METILTTKEAGQRLRVSADTVRDLIHAGKLKGFNVNAGRRNKIFRIFESDLETYCRSQMQPDRISPSDLPKIHRPKLRPFKHLRVNK